MTVTLTGIYYSLPLIGLPLDFIIHLKFVVLDDYIIIYDYYKSTDLVNSHIVHVNYDMFMILTSICKLQTSQLS